MEAISLRNKKIKFDRKKDPHGWIQWKGTNVCIDIHCKCGEMSHIDDYFMYYVECPYCNRIYEANGFIQLIELNIKQKKEVKEKVPNVIIKGEE